MLYYFACLFSCSLIVGNTVVSNTQFRAVKCPGYYKGHLQGVCTDDKVAIYWSFTDALVKTDSTGKILKKIPVANHHGDLCYHDGTIYVATNLGRFNDPKGNADSWVYSYKADELAFVKRYKVADVFHGAGGIAVRNGRFFVVGGLPKGVQENYIYEYDPQFRLQKKHVLKSGYTLLGIQTATFANGHFWFGCYGTKLLKVDALMKMVGKYDFDCGLGVVGLPNGKFFVASGRRIPDKGNMGQVAIAVSDDKKGFVVSKK